MFIAELGVEALCLEFYPGPSCMDKKKKPKRTRQLLYMLQLVYVRSCYIFFPLNIHTSARSINEETCSAEFSVRCGGTWPGLQKKPDDTEEKDRAVTLVLVEHGHFVMVLQRERTVHG